MYKYPFNDMCFHFDFTPLIIVFIASSLLIFIFLIVVIGRRILSVARRVDECDKNNIDNHQLPDLSVIVYTHGLADTLTLTLRNLFNQDYNGRIEIIVVTDGRSEHIEDVVKMFSVEYRNLRFTYVPDEAHYISRGKLALTLGIKAAKYDFVLLTDAEASIESSSWLQRMAFNLTERNDVVIGYTRMVDEQTLKMTSSLLAFDILFESVVWLSGALKNNPYRAAIANLAFRKSLFFEKRGFADALNLHYGEDDIFISHLCKNSPYAVELARDAQIDYKCYNLKGQHAASRINHIFTGRYVSHKSPLLFGTASLALWLELGLTVALIVLAFPNLVPGLIGLVLWITAIVVLSLFWTKTAKTLSVHYRGWLTPLFMMWHPFYGLKYKIKAKFNTQKNFTWSKPLK